MKHTTVTARSIFRVLLVITALLAVFALTFSASAANTLTDAKMTYDFSSYSSLLDIVYDESQADKGGWKVSCILPDGATVAPAVVINAASVGCTDYSTRRGEVCSDLTLTYVVPASDRISVKDYDVITYTRALHLVSGFARSGAQYSITFVMDDGQSVEITRDWIDIDMTADKTEESVFVGKMFDDLDGTPKLEKIEYRPYVNREEFMVSAVVENNSLVQFLTSFMTFETLTPAPVGLVGVADDYNGEDILTHNGKITGLDPLKTYEYKLTYADEWISVSGKTEITGLAGAAYRVRVLPDSDSPYAASYPIAVVVPRTTYTPFDYSKDRVSSGDFTSLKSDTAQMGVWTSPAARPYNAVGRLTINSSASALNGSTNADGGYFYRREQLVFEYILTADEQIDVADAVLSFRVLCSGSFPYASREDVSGQMRIYISSQEEPIILDNIVHGYDEVEYQFSFKKNLPEITGNVEKIVYIPFYEQYADAVNFNNYPQLINPTLIETQPPRAPSVIVVELSEGRYKIFGLNSSIQYEVSRDMQTWEDVEKGATGVEVSELGEYYIRQKESENTMAGEIATAVVKRRVAAPTGITVSGTSIVGLDASKEYEYVAYDMHASDYTKVSGVTSISSLAPGLWAVRYAEGESSLASDNLYLFIEGSAQKGKVTRQAQTDGNLRGFAVGEISSDVRQVSLYVAMKDASHFVMYSGWTKTTDMSVNADLNVKYAFTSAQAFDIKDIYKFSYKAGIQGSGFYLNNGSYTGFCNKIRFHVVGSDVEYYDVLVPWSHNSKLSPNVADLLPAHAHGYVVGYTFFYYGAWPEISETLRSGNPYPTYYMYDMTLSSKVSAPNPTISCDANGKFTISGLSSSYAHGYTLDKENYTEIAKGTTSFTVTKPGTYYVYAEDTTGKKSEVVEVKAVLPSTIATSGLSVTGNTITGLKDYLNYEYRKVSFGESAGEFISVPAGATKIAALSTGIWEVRHLTGSDVTAASQYLLIGGNNQGSLAHKAVYTTVGEKDDGVRGFAENRWTSSVSHLYYDSATSAATIRLATNWTTSVAQDDLDKFYYSYQLSEDEIVATSDMGAISFRFGTGISWPFSTNSYVSRVRYYVIGSDVEYYDELVSASGDYALRTSNLSAISGTKGFVVAIRIWPVATLPEGTTIVNAGNRFPVIKFTVKDTGLDDVKLKYRINFKDMKPDTLSIAEENTDLFRRYKITGLDSSKSYEFSYDGTSFSAVSSGATEITGLVGGTYYVRYAGSNTAVKLVTPSMTPAFTDKTVSKYPYVISSDTSYEGMWNTYPGAMELSENYITTRIKKDDLLSSAAYNYTFNKEHQFKVYENPIFTADFNNELMNMNMPLAFIDGAVAKVEIYFEETDKPYTLTWEWKGKTVTNGATANKHTVNLIDIAPELANLTVKAFKLIPYSNLETTPNDYNTSAANDRYMYFRLLNIGFMSTPANVDALVSGNYVEVNKYVGVEVENFPETLAIGEEIDLDAITVKAIYSDETFTEIGKHMYKVSDLSFDKAGRYTVEISYRNKSVLKDVDVAFDVSTLQINTLPAKTLYVVGETFDKSGLTLSFKTPDGVIAVVSDGFVVDAPAFDSEGTKTVSVEYADTTLTFEVDVISADKQIKLKETSTLTLDADSKRVKGVVQNTTVAELLANFEEGVAVVNRSGSVVSDTSVLVGTGFAVITYDESAVYDKVEIVVRGDINGNGRIDTNDYLMIKRACIGSINIVDGSVAFEAADVNENGSIDSNDYVQIKNHYRGRINIFE